MAILFPGELKYTIKMLRHDKKMYSGVADCFNLGLLILSETHNVLRRLFPQVYFSCTEQETAR